MDCATRQPVKEVLWCDEESATYAVLNRVNGRPWIERGAIAEKVVQARHVMVEPKHLMIYVIH